MRRVAAANPNTVVVVNTGMPDLMPWTGEVAAVLQAWFPGQSFGDALADVLTGSAEPGGRLPVTLPRAAGDSPVLFAQPDAGNLEYSEGLLVGYRGYDRGGAQPLFAFGHGLGYTDWEYRSIELSGDDAVVTVRNAGSRPGNEVVQVYVEAPPAVTRPVRTLAAFARLEAAPGETVQARVRLDPRALMQFDEARREWVSRPGTYTIRAGRSSRDLRVATKLVQ